MDTAIAPTALGETTRTQDPLGRLAALPLRTKVGLGLGTALLAAVIAGGAMLGNQPDWRVLYANLGDKDGGQVIAALSQMNVPHRFTDMINPIGLVHFFKIVAVEDPQNRQQRDTTG